jgi:mono/diheme cytochrome c family protein
VRLKETSLDPVRRLLIEDRRTRWIAASLTIAALLSFPFVVTLNGKPHADWQQFLGRFHVLAVHLPIGLILLVPLLEIVGASRPALRQAAGFVLALGFAACAGSLVLGILLAYGSGEAGETVTRHMWGGIVVTIGALVCILARPAWSTGTIRVIYPSLLACVLLALVWTAHEGGSIARGSGYLTEFMPAPLKSFSVLGNVSAAANSDSFYAQHIDPVFAARCVSCHGASKREGGLRLDSYDRLMRGGRNGAVIAPGRPDRSLLLGRVTLPTNDKHFMPAEGRPPLKPEEIAWLRAWIQQGASPAVTALAGISLPQARSEIPPEPVGDYGSLMPEIRAMQAAQGAKLVPVSSKPSDGLILSAVDVAPSFGDAQLQQFVKFAPYIVEAELGRTAVTDASFDTLAKFTHLRALHLEGTAVTGAGIQKLAALSQLTYLNLSGTRVTAAAAAQLAAMKNLRRVYLFNTPAQPAQAAEPLQEVSKGAQ